MGLTVQRNCFASPSAPMAHWICAYTLVRSVPRSCAAPPRGRRGGAAAAKQAQWKYSWICRCRARLGHQFLNCAAGNGAVHPARTPALPHPGCAPSWRHLLLGGCFIHNHNGLLRCSAIAKAQILINQLQRTQLIAHFTGGAGSAPRSANAISASSASTRSAVIFSKASLLSGRGGSPHRVLFPPVQQVLLGTSAS